jgi:hypothetical protein
MDPPGNPQPVETASRLLADDGRNASTSKHEISIKALQKHEYLSCRRNEEMSPHDRNASRKNPPHCIS